MIMNKDKKGNPIGTYYDSTGKPVDIQTADSKTYIYDDKGKKLGAIEDVFEEEEAGEGEGEEPELDGKGNPKGTYYTKDGKIHDPYDPNYQGHLPHFDDAGNEVPREKIVLP
jgi:hypothetical protein